MKTLKLTALLLVFCLVLSACMALPGQNTTPDSPISNNQSNSDQNKEEAPPEEGSNSDNKTDEPMYPAEITAELVVEWALADTLLPLLDDLSQLLHEAVKEAGCQLDRVTITINTAGAYTADSLVGGGIEVAILPSVDIISYEGRAAILALSEDELHQTAIAVSLADSNLSENFRAILFSALTQTQSGQDFLAAFCGEAVFAAPTEEALQTVRDYLHELEEGERK